MKKLLMCFCVAVLACLVCIPCFAEGETDVSASSTVPSATSEPTPVVNYTATVEGTDVNVTVNLQSIPSASSSDSADSAVPDSDIPAADPQNLDDPVEPSGFAAVVHDLLGDYHVRTVSVNHTLDDGTVVTSVSPVPGLAGLDYYWLAGFVLFAIVLYALMRCIGVVLKNG
jgi:hypothetical protein